MTDSADTPYSPRYREGVSLLKNSIQARSWLHRPALEAPNRALEPRNRRFSTRIEGQTQATESFSTGSVVLGNSEGDQGAAAPAPKLAAFSPAVFATSRRVILSFVFTCHKWLSSISDITLGISGGAERRPLHTVVRSLPERAAGKPTRYVQCDDGPYHSNRP